MTDNTELDRARDALAHHWSPSYGPGITRSIEALIDAKLIAREEIARSEPSRASGGDGEPIVCAKCNGHGCSEDGEEPCSECGGYREKTITSAELLRRTGDPSKPFVVGSFPPEMRMMPARDGIEAQRGLNDVFPGDPYPAGAPSPPSEPAQATEGEVNVETMLHNIAYAEARGDHSTVVSLKHARRVAEALRDRDACIAELERKRDAEKSKGFAQYLDAGRLENERDTAEAALADIRERVKTVIDILGRPDGTLPKFVQSARTHLSAILTPSPTAGDTDTPEVSDPHDERIGEPWDDPDVAPPAGHGIYIASKAKHGTRWQMYRARGVPIISTWIDESGEGETADYHDLWHRCATEAANAAVTIVYHEQGETLKGALLEAGAALSHGRRIIVVGDPPGTWIRHHNVTTAATIDDAFREAAAITAGDTDTPAPAPDMSGVVKAAKTALDIVWKQVPLHTHDEAYVAVAEARAALATLQGGTDER